MAKMEKVARNTKSQRFSVLTYNVNFGLVRSKNRVSNYAVNVVKAIKESKAEIVLLQETNEAWVCLCCALLCLCLCVCVVYVCVCVCVFMYVCICMFVFFVFVYVCVCVSFYYYFSQPILKEEYLMSSGFDEIYPNRKFIHIGAAGGLAVLTKYEIVSCELIDTRQMMEESWYKHKSQKKTNMNETKQHNQTKTNVGFLICIVKFQLTRNFRIFMW